MELQNPSDTTLSHCQCLSRLFATPNIKQGAGTPSILSITYRKTWKGENKKMNGKQEKRMETEKKEEKRSILRADQWD